MSLPIVFRREAEREYEEAAAWYEEQQAGLGAVFVARVESVLEQLRSTPAVYRTVHKDARRAPVRQFPYGVIYRIETNRVLVLAIFHASRDPVVWQSRT